jgi:hypothetical protein
VLTGEDYPPAYFWSSASRSLRILPDALEIDRLFATKPIPCDCLVMTARHLLFAVERVQELIRPGSTVEVIPPALRGGLWWVAEKCPNPALGWETGEPPSQEEYQRVLEYIATLDFYLEVLQPAAFAESVGAREWQAASLIKAANATQLALFFIVQQHGLLNHYALDIAEMDQVKFDLQRRGEVNPLEALVPVARTIQAIFAARTTCDCISDFADSLVNAMEAIRSVAPQPRTN